MPLSSFFGGVQRFAGQALGEAQRKYKEADRNLGGWLPGGGTASPLTKMKQEGERKIAERILQQEQDYVGKTGRFASQGQIMNAIRATTDAGANPLSLLAGNPESVKQVAEYYAQNPDLQNQYDLNTNMFLRYISGTGSEGLKIAPEVGRQLYSDIQKQEQKFLDPKYRDMQIGYHSNPPYIKENLLQGKTPVYYGGYSDAVAPHRALLPIDIGERWQLQNSLGSYWAQPSDNGYEIKGERYNFSYAPSEKEGKQGVYKGQIIPGSMADVGRNLVKMGYGTPYTTNLQINPGGQVTVR